MRPVHPAHPPHKARHPARLQQHLGRIHELAVYGAGAALALSGLGWLACHYLLRAPGPSPQPLEPWWLRLHGLAMLVFLIVLGSVLPVHVRYGWRHRMNRGSGVPMLATAGLLTLTGYGLYYLVDDDLRAWTSLVHWWTGLGAILLLAVHVLLGRRRRQGA